MTREFFAGRWGVASLTGRWDQSRRPAALSTCGSTTWTVRGTSRDCYNVAYTGTPTTPSVRTPASSVWTMVRSQTPYIDPEIAITSYSKLVVVKV